MTDEVTPAKTREPDPRITLGAKNEANQILKMCPVEQEPVLSILRVHLLAEHYLERAIAVVLPRGDRITDAGLLSFAQKLNLVQGMDVLPDQVIQSLKGLNRVRNSCAHEMEREITIPDIERIGRPFGAEFTSLRQQHYPDVKNLLNEVVWCLGRELSKDVYFLERKAAERFETKLPKQST